MTKVRIRVTSKSRRWTEKAFFLLGVIALGVWVWSVASNAVFQDWESWVFDREIHGEQSTIYEYVAQTKDRVAADVRAWLGYAATPEPSMPRPHISTTDSPPVFLGKDGLVGRLIIPRLHLRAMVCEGADEKTLRLALGHIPGTALPGQKGNVGVAGHRDTLFRDLREIDKDDLILFQTLARNYVYQVETTEIVKPQNVGVLNAHEYPELTLVTCYPFYYVGSAPERFVVKARQVPQGHTDRDITETPQQKTVEYKVGIKRVTFEVNKAHSQQVSPGISLGLTGIEMARHRVNGWVWVMPDRRTIWLRDQSIRKPVVFYGHLDGKRRELVITNVTANSVTGYLLLPEQGLHPKDGPATD